MLCPPGFRIKRRLPPMAFLGEDTQIHGMAQLFQPAFGPLDDVHWLARIQGAATVEDSNIPQVLEEQVVQGLASAHRSASPKTRISRRQKPGPVTAV